MKQKIITLLVMVLIAGLLSLVVIVSNNKEKQVAEQKIEELKNADPIFYYGNTCYYCKQVEEWFEANSIEEKIEFSQKEVYDDRQNAAELAKAAASCGLDTSSIAVPFLYAEGQCLIGSPDIINYFAQKLNIDVVENQEASAPADLNN